MRAVVLRGPPCGGKSKVAGELKKQLTSSSALVSLDEGWGRDEKRFRDDGRYSDLISPVDTLIVELGFGEPIGESFHGATRDPGAWLRVLREAGRSVKLFLLKPPVHEVFKRISIDRHPRQQEYFRCAALRYENGGVCTHEVFEERIGSAYSELVIDTSRESKEMTAARILQEIGGA